MYKIAGKVKNQSNSYQKTGIESDELDKKNSKPKTNELIKQPKELKKQIFNNWIRDKRFNIKIKKKVTANNKFKINKLIETIN